MSEVAREAGVSQAAVSLVLNDKKGMIGAEARQRVLDAAAKLGYRRNLHAGTLRTGRTYCLGLLGHMGGFALDNYVFTGVARGAEDELAETGSPFALLTFAASWERGQAKSLDLIERGLVDGVVCVVAAGALESFERERLAWFRERGVRCVAVHSLGARALDYPYVGFDSRAGGRLAAEHFARLGYASIGLYLNSPGGPQSNEIREGFEAGLRAQGRELESRWVFEDRNPDRKPAFDAGYAWARQVAPTALPRALLVTLDACAHGIWKAFRERGLRVPEDIALLGYDDDAPARYGLPDLSSVKHPFREKGRAAARMLAALVEDAWPSDQPTRTILAPTLALRRSCGGGNRS
ncbi:MAG: LacI family DNA-binding transcriptional regulator [Planctomycetes bacterium]|nr:LacI family DNA-binding transcriptional regulator [Planctomycetota bacterium]